MAARGGGAQGGCDREGGDDDDPIINQDGCGKFYGLLEQCLGEGGRDWRRCQAQLQAWKQCSLESKRKAAPPAAAAAPPPPSS
eukprot:SAG22_NODE_378_length_11517_cov_26.335523_9_plen_83_part_00